MSRGSCSASHWRRQVTRTIEGRERYPVIVRYERGHCQDLSNLERVLVKRRRRKSRWRSSRRSLLSLRSAMIGDENGQLAVYIYVDTSTRDIGGDVEAAKQAVATEVHLPAGHTPPWTGRHEFQSARERLEVLI